MSLSIIKSGKRIVYLLLLVHGIFRAVPELVGRELSLEGKWLFKLGDDTTWVQPDVPDSLWFPIKVPSYWENQNYELYDGFAWYRRHITLDSTFIKADSAVLILGKIDDADEAYFNGVKIGSSGNLPPHPISAKNALRRYLIPGNLLRVDNVLSVRVYDDGKNGGIYSGPIKIMTPEAGTEAPITAKILQNSYNQIPFTNGIGAGNYNIKTRTFTHFYPHIYRYFNDQQETVNLIKSARAVVFYNNREIPLAALQTIDVGYVEGTGIVKHILGGPDFTLTQYAFCPFTLDKPVWIIFLIAEGSGCDSLTLNFMVQTNDLNLDIGKWAYQNERQKWLAAFLYYHKENTESETLFLPNYKNSHPGFQALTEELDWWESWHKKTILPAEISPAAKRTYLQSLAILKMAQCREGFPAGGQIIAALPPSNQNFCWVRDQAQSIDALISAGHLEEARAALQFLMNSRAGRFKQYRWNNYNLGIGKDYAISIYRYYGNGIEQTTIDDYGLTLHLDGFGLTLWNLRRYAEVSGDVKFISYYWPKIANQIADILPSLIDETGLVRAEPGPWEKTLPFKHYIYTDACTYRGLIDAAQLARLMNDETRALRYEETAINLRISIEKNLIDPNENCLMNTLEDRDPNLYVDASTAEALLWIFNPQDRVHKGTLTAFNKYLALNSPARGYRRNKTDLANSSKEWIFGDLRIVGALLKAVNFAEANRLQDWLTLQVNNNFNLLPQYLDAQTGDYSGVVPRCGLGAGAYIANFWRN